MTNIYIASCVKDGGIYHYTLEENGTLRYVSKTPADRPMYMIAKDGKMYTILRQPFENSDDSGIFTMNISESGELQAPSPICSTKGTVACHLDISDGNIYAVNYVSGSVIKLPDTLVQHHGCLLYTSPSPRDRG